MKTIDVYNAAVKLGYHSSVGVSAFEYIISLAEQTNDANKEVIVLAAQVENLKCLCTHRSESIDKLLAKVQQLQRAINKCEKVDSLRDYLTTWAHLKALSKLTPDQCLADHDIKVVKAAFIEASRYDWDQMDEDAPETMATEYANQLYHQVKVGE